MAKSALITGAAGQDGGYLIDLLLSRGYVVHAQSRHAQARSPETPSLVWHTGALTDFAFLQQLIDVTSPDEIYNLAAVSSPSLSWTVPYETTLLNAIVPQQICELVLKSNRSCRIFQCSSSEMFGDTSMESQSEDTFFMPESPYGITKYFAHKMMGIYRSQFGLHVSCGILFNHESPRRSLRFVSQKIAHAAAALSLGITTTRDLDELGKPIVNAGQLKLGNIHVRRDFGFAGDVVEAMTEIVQSDTPDDYVIGTGQNRSIADFCEAAFRYVALDWREHVSADEALVRQHEKDSTCANPAKLINKFGWKPKVTFEGLVAMMVEGRLTALRASRRG